MSTKPLSQQQRKRKMLLLLPLFLLPFVLLLFYAIGGGKKKADPVPEKGLNTELPSAKLKDDKSTDKLSLYQQADRDSIRGRGSRLFDPFNFSPDQQPATTPEQPVADESPFSVKGKSSTSLDDNEKRVNERLAILQQTLNTPSRQVPGTTSRALQEDPPIQQRHPVNNFPTTVDTQEDAPELSRLNQMLDKVLDVQHPERVASRQKEASDKQPTKVFPVTRSDNAVESIDLVPPTDTIRSKTAIRRTITAASRFFELSEDDTTENQNAIRAVVHQSQELVSGATLKMRLVDELFIHGKQIPAGTFVYGTAELSGDRLRVHISNISFASSIYPVSLEAYDLDGIAGIYEPGSITRDASKQSADQAMQSLQLATLNPSIGAQAAASGLETMKTIIQRKVRLVRVTVKAGHPILLYSDR